MALPEYETLSVSVDEDGVATLTLNRPDQLNAFNVTMARELERFFLTDARSDDIAAVVVTGAGRAFCAGMDLSRAGERLRPRRDPRPVAGGVPRPLRRAALPGRAPRHRRTGHPGDPRAPEAGHRRDQRRCRGHRGDDDARHGHPARLDRRQDRVHLRPHRDHSRSRLHLVPPPHRRSATGPRVGLRGGPPLGRPGSGGSSRPVGAPSRGAGAGGPGARPLVRDGAAHRSRWAWPSTSSTSTRARPSRSRRTCRSPSGCSGPRWPTGRKAWQPSWRSGLRSSPSKASDLPRID